MKRSFLLVVFTLIVLMLIPDTSEAQNKYKRRKGKNKSLSKYSGSRRRVSGRFRPYTFVGANLNAGNYFGDLSPLNKAASTDISFTRPGLGIFMGRKTNSRTALRLAFNWVRVSATDFSADPNGEASAPARYTRNLSFRNDILELSLGAEVDLFENQGSSTRRVPFTPYLTFGIAGFYHNPMGQVPEYDTHDLAYNVTNPSGSPESVRFSNAGDWVSLRDFGTEGQLINGQGKELYNTFQFSVPVGIGIRIRLPDNFDAALEFGYRFTFTDYLDDASGNYANLGLFTDPLARAFADRSLEATDVLSGSARDLTRAQQVSGRLTEISTVNGDRIRVRPSFFDDEDIRGNPDDNDVYFVTQIKLSYIINGVRRKAKFR